MPESEWFGYAPLGPAGSGHGRTRPRPAPEGRPHRFTEDKIHEAAREGRYWVLRRESDGAGWTLRHLDDTTGEIGPAEHATGNPDPTAAGDWARELVDVSSWHTYGDLDYSPDTDPDDWVDTWVESLRAVVVDIAWRRPIRGKALRVSIEDDPHTPDLQVVVAREWWPATGKVGSSLGGGELQMFRDVDGALDWASEAFGIDRDRWVVVTPDREFTSPVAT